MIGHGIVSSYEGNLARVLSYDTPGHITPPLAIPAYISPRPEIGAFVVYAEFPTSNTGAVLAIMEEGS